MAKPNVGNGKPNVSNGKHKAAMGRNILIKHIIYHIYKGFLLFYYEWGEWEMKEAILIEKIFLIKIIDDIKLWWERF